MAALAVLTDPDPLDLWFLDERLYEFNVAATGIDDGRFLTILVRDDDGAIVAGLHGSTWGDCCEVKTLWVHEERRHQGLGSELLRTAETEAARRGARQILLTTHTFQAPAFYARHGYETLYRVDGYPSPHGQYWLRKRLPA